MAASSSANWLHHECWVLFWIVVNSVLALALLLATLASFDRCLGRITLRSPAASSRITGMALGSEPD